MKTTINPTILFLCLTTCLRPADVQAELTLYATDTTSDNLFALSLTDGSGSVVGPFGSADAMGGLAYDAVNGILYGSDVASGNLYSINESTGAATLIGPLGARLMQGLAFRNTTGMLYGTAYPGAGDLMTSLYRIDTATGAATSIGSTGFDSVSGLAFHPVTDVLYGVAGVATGVLLAIDQATGAGAIVADDIQAIDGLAFHPFTNVLYGVDNGTGQTPDSLYTIDLSTGAASLIGPTSVGNNLGLEFGGYSVVPEPASVSLFAVGAVLMLTGYRRWANRQNTL